MLIEIGKKARLAARHLAVSSTEEKDRALIAIADALRAGAAMIIEENEKDLAAGREAGLSASLLDRLALDEGRIAGIADAVVKITTLPDPVGRVLDETTRPNGLHLAKVAVPLGVVAVIYEARPNVTVDSAALCLKSGNAVILRGGKEAIHSNTILERVMRDALESVGFSADCIQLVHSTDRAVTRELMGLKKYVDVLIPRGGAGLIRAVVENATVPVIETGAGTCHIYVDRDADIDMAAEIIYNAKTSRPSVCNAAECMLVHRDIAERALPVIAARLADKQVEIRADETAKQILPTATLASDEDWGREYGDYIIACRVVDSLDAAVDHITEYGTGHSECIVTRDGAAAQRFTSMVDAAAVYHNASTRFTDGGEFGLGAEIGISTQKLHARGPLGLAELTSMKYIVSGNGQVR